MFYIVEYLFNLFVNILSVIALPLIVISHWGEWNTVKNRFSKKANKIMSIIGIIILLGFEILMIPDTIDYLKDLPAFITKDYAVEVGQISDTYEEGGRNHHQVIVVNGIELKGGVSYNDKQKYYDYKFYYLPNTHWIMIYVGYK